MGVPLQHTTANRAADGCFNPKFWWPSPRRCELRGGPASPQGETLMWALPSSIFGVRSSCSASAASNLHAARGGAVQAAGFPAYLPPFPQWWRFAMVRTSPPFVFVRPLALVRPLIGGRAVGDMSGRRDGASDVESLRLLCVAVALRSDSIKRKMGHCAWRTHLKEKYRSQGLLIKVLRKAYGCLCPPERLKRAASGRALE